MVVACWDRDVPISSLRLRFEASESGAREGGLEGEPAGRPGWESRFTTSVPSGGGGWRWVSRSCSCGGIGEGRCSVLSNFSGRSAVEVELEAVVVVVCCYLRLALCLAFFKSTGSPSDPSGGLPERRIGALCRSWGCVGRCWEMRRKKHCSGAVCSCQIRSRSLA